jgi:hypothetical protein
MRRLDALELLPDDDRRVVDEILHAYLASFA